MPTDDTLISSTNLAWLTGQLVYVGSTTDRPQDVISFCGSGELIQKICTEEWAGKAKQFAAFPA